MKQIVNYINERLHITTKSHARQYTYHPETKKELQKIIIQRIQDNGPDCDLNDIDVSKITDMSFLFDANEEYMGSAIFKDFNGDISNWDVSNVKYMYNMFAYCEKFNCDISDWDVSNVTHMNGMFDKCNEFNCDLSAWDVSNVIYINFMFNQCNSFKQNLDRWVVTNVKDMWNAFKDCPTQPKWYKWHNKK